MKTSYSNHTQSPPYINQRHRFSAATVNALASEMSMQVFRASLPVCEKEVEENLVFLMDITTREWPNVPFGWLLLSGSIKNSTVFLSWEEQSPLSPAHSTPFKNLFWRPIIKQEKRRRKNRKNVCLCRYCLCSNFLACKIRARVHGRIEQRHYRHITIF